MFCVVLFDHLEDLRDGAALSSGDCTIQGFLMDLHKLGMGISLCLGALLSRTDEAEFYEYCKDLLSILGCSCVAFRKRDKVIRSEIVSHQFSDGGQCGNDDRASLGFSFCYSANRRRGGEQQVQSSPGISRMKTPYASRQPSSLFSYGALSLWRRYISTSAFSKEPHAERGILC